MTVSIEVGTDLAMELFLMAWERVPKYESWAGLIVLGRPGLSSLQL